MTPAKSIQCYYFISVSARKKHFYSRRNERRKTRVFEVVFEERFF